MKNGNVIEVRDVYKSFKVHKDKTNELKNIFVYRNYNKFEIKQILNGISFDVKQGEAVALIGNNGCGKSTTLKLLTRILKPNSGTIEMCGKTSSLIELGAGFHPDMSGRENIYINASIFGIKKKEVDRRLDDIIRFSEIEEYIDNPVRTYSSGMYMRLAFSIAINVDADILLIDEILAVGDAAFQTKCFNKLKELKRSGKTIVIVSHSLQQVESICDRVIWIDDGKIKEEGDTRTICRHYIEEMDHRRAARDEYEKKFKSSFNTLKDISDTCSDVSRQVGKNAKRNGNQQVYFENVQICNEKFQESIKYETGDKVIIRFKYKSLTNNVKVSFYIGIVREDGVSCYENSTKREFDCYAKISDKGVIEYVINNLTLLTGAYRFEFRIYGENGELYDELNDFIDFSVNSGSIAEGGVVSLEHNWKL